MTKTRITRAQRDCGRRSRATLGRSLCFAGLAMLVLMAAAPLPVLATAYTATADGNWSAPATWGGSGYPSSSGDTATINATRTLDVDVSVTIDRLTAEGPYAQTLNATTPNAITVNTLSNANANSFTIGNGLSLNIAGMGIYINRGGIVHGALKILNGATLKYTMTQAQNGSGLIHVQPGGKVDMQSNSSYNAFDGATGLTIDNDGLFEFNNSGTFTIKALTVTGDGEWRVNSGGMSFSNPDQTISLNPASALFTGSTGTVAFSDAKAGTHMVGAFNMSGSNTVAFSDNTSTTFVLNRASTFQNLSVTGGVILDLAPAGGGAKTNTVSGALTWDGALKASDAGGAVLNVSGNLVRTAISTTEIGAGVTVNVAGPSSVWSGNAGATIQGNLNITSGGGLLFSARVLSGAGTWRVNAGATVTLDGSANNNRQIDVNIVNNGLMRSINSNIRPFNGVVSGTGVFRAESGTFDLDASTTTVAGWSGTGTLASLATWHAQGAGIIDFNGNNNSITAIGAGATVILENGGTLLQLNASARNALTVNGALHVRGTSNLQFSSAQSLTVASGGLLGGGGTITVAGGGQVNVQSGGTLATELDGASATKLTVSGGSLTVAGLVEVRYAAKPTADEYLIATAPAITCTAATTGEAGWKAQVRGGTELWLVKQYAGTMIILR